MDSRNVRLWMKACNKRLAEDISFFLKEINAKTENFFLKK